MSHHCWVFVLLVVVVVSASPDDTRAHQCKQKGRSLANLELVEDALKKAKQLYPNCGEGNDNSSCSECNKKDKSLGFIDIALDLVANDKNNILICPHDTTEEFRPMDCQDLLAAGVETSGVYNVWLRGEKSAVRVRCDMDTDGGGWTVFQRRGNFSEQEDFDRRWNAYKGGFGNLKKDFWLGNHHIFALTNQGKYSLRMDMTAADGDSAYAFFQEFRIEDENANYKLHVAGYKGNAGGDGMASSNTQMFSTKDRKSSQSRNCTEELKGGFWYKAHSLYNSCYDYNPNGVYNPGVQDFSSMFYLDFRGYVGLFSMEMKLKRM